MLCFVSLKIIIWNEICLLEFSIFKKKTLFVNSRKIEILLYIYLLQRKPHWKCRIYIWQGHLRDISIQGSHQHNYSVICLENPELWVQRGSSPPLGCCRGWHNCGFINWILVKAFPLSANWDKTLSLPSHPSLIPWILCYVILVNEPWRHTPQWWSTQCFKQLSQWRYITQLEWTLKKASGPEVPCHARHSF